MIFKINNCEFGFKDNGVQYRFDDVQNLTIEDNRKNRLTRGANGANKIGLVYTEGTREPIKWTLPILNMTAAIKSVLDDIFTTKRRIDVYCIDETDGSSKMAKQAILCNKPQQLSLDDTPDSMNVSLEFETFDSSEVHKS